MKCRRCKKDYDSNEWKESGTMYGFCSIKCKKETLKNCIKSPISKALTKAFIKEVV